jgi:hypothetical protein
VKEIGVTEAKIQTVEDIYRLVRTAVVSKRPIRAIYNGRERWFCLHKLGRNREGQTRVLCYQYRGRASAGCKLLAPRQTGVVSSWRNLAE